MTMASPYVLRETGGNLLRNVVMTVAAIVTMAVSLTALGGVLIMRQAVNTATVQWQGGVEMIIFMEPRASAQEIAAINHEVASMTPTEITSCRFLDKNQAWAQFKVLFNGQPELVKVMTASAMPTSFQCVPAKAQSITQLASEFRDQPGVYQVGYPGQIIAETLAHFSALRTVALIVAGGVMLGAIALVVNTIQLAIFARRRRSRSNEARRGHQLVHPRAVHAGRSRRGAARSSYSFPDHIFCAGYFRLVHRQQPDRR